jgi:hypothetical protein
MCNYFPGGLKEHHMFLLALLQIDRSASVLADHLEGLISNGSATLVEERDLRLAYTDRDDVL